MKFYDKIAVFDLDGTLWKENSHYEILNKYFQTNFYKSIWFRIFNHFFKKKMYCFICKKYEEIPKDFVNSFSLDFDPEILELLRLKQEANFFCVIISNAPLEIISKASSRLNIPYLKAPIGRKKLILDENYSYNELFVCTDNKEDIDLIVASISRKIIITRYNRKFFKREGYIS